MSKVLYVTRPNGARIVTFYCHACSVTHEIELPPEDARPINVDSPTIYPEFRVEVPATESTPASLCHRLIRNGNYKYYPDCTHDFKGKIVPMADYPAK